MRRGFSLALVLTLAALAFLLVGSALDTSLKLHAREQRLRSRHQATLYCKNALQKAIARLAQDPGWGKNASDGLSVMALAGHPADAGARVTFDPTSPDASVNHFEAEGTPEVPKNTVHLWSVGTYRGVKVRLEASLSRPPFPFAIASSGSLVTSGSFFAGSVDNPEHADLSSPDFLRNLKQASLLSNGASVSLAGSPVRVTGDVISAGTVELGTGVTVDGEVRRHAAPKPIPAFDLASFDTAGKPLLNELPPGDLRRSAPLKGYARCEGDLRVVNGLRLEEAILFVDGDLRVSGSLSGRGAVFVTGDVVVDSTALGALDQLALISGGSLTVSGSGRERSKLVGLLVSRGNLKLSNLTVVGAVVCAGKPDQELRLENVNAFGSPKGLEFEFEVGWSVPTEYRVTGSATLGGGGLVRLAQVTDAQTGEKREARPADFVTRYSPSSPDAPLLRESDFEVVLEDGSVKTLAEAGIDTSSFLRDELLEPLNSFARAQAQTSPEQMVARGKLSLDLNKFLRVGDTLQVVYRRIH